MTESFTVPHAAPAYGPPPYVMTRAEVVIADVRVDPEAAAAAVPPPLKLVSGDRAQVFVGDMIQIPHVGKFHEGGVILRVQYEDVEAPFTPYLWTSSEEAMIVGREVYGMPKVFCDDDPLEWLGNQIRGRVVRRGRTLLDVDFNMETQVDAASMSVNSSRLSVRHFPDPVDPESRPRDVLLVPLTDYTVQEAWQGRAAVDFGESAFSRVHHLRPLEVLGATYFRGSWTLDRAERLAP